MKCVILIVAFALAVAGCGTVSQHAVEPASVGFYVKPIKVANGYLVDATFRERYNALIEIYGRKKLENGAPVFAPPLVHDFGVALMGDGQWLMTNEAMENMIVLSDLKRRGAAP